MANLRYKYYHEKSLCVTKTMTFQRPQVQICLATNHQSYGIGDTIQGEVLLTPQKRILSEQLNVLFEGRTEVEVDKNGNNIPLPPSTASSTFLQMKQPLEAHLSGLPKTFESGTQYQVPFKFVVPPELPHHICHHHRHHEQVYWEHTQLPPSIGTPFGLGDGKLPFNDMTPTILSITYRIHVRIHSGKAQKNGGPTNVGEWSYPVHIIPRRKERPPIWVPDDSKFYRIRQDRQIAKGLRRRHVGLLSACAEQPPAVRTQTNPTNSFKIKLQYTAAGQDPLPEFSGLDLKLKAVTTYGGETWPDFPDLTDPFSWISSQDYYSDTTFLHNSLEGQLEWRKQSVGENIPYDTNTSADLTYTAILELPITLPKHVCLPPSFYSCLISRTYALKLLLNVRVEGQWTKSKVSLTIPVQIC